jgi:hypothetical protein
MLQLGLYVEAVMTKPLAVLLCAIACTSVYADDKPAKETAKEVGRTLGTATREAGQETKKAAKEVGKAVAEAARETGHAFRDGAKEFKKAVKGEDAPAKQQK